MNLPGLLLLGLCVASLSACSVAPVGGKSTTPDKTPAVTAPATPQNTLADPVPVKPGGWWQPAESADPVTTLSWSRSGKLLVGYRDAFAMSVSDKLDRADILRLWSEKAPVLGFSGNGKQAVVRAKRAMLVSVPAGEPLLRLSQPVGCRAVAWAPLAGSFMVADKEHRIHVWEQAQKIQVFEGDSLTDMMKRQNPSHSFPFPMTLDGPMLFTPDDRLVFSDDKGQVILFDVHGDHMAQTLYALETPIHSLAVSGNHVVAVSQQGKMRAASLDPYKVLSWTRKIKATQVALSEQDSTPLINLGPEALAAHEMASGKVLWSYARPSGEACGVAVNPEGTRLAACVDGVVGVFDVKTGKPLAWVARKADGAYFAPSK